MNWLLKDATPVIFTDTDGVIRPNPKEWSK
jgi:hypothetical protein